MVITSPFEKANPATHLVRWTRRVWDTQQILVNRSRRGKFSVTPLWKRGARGDFLRSRGSIVPRDSRSATKKTSPHHNQIPLDPPFPKGESITANHLPPHPHVQPRRCVAWLVSKNWGILFHGVSDRIVPLFEKEGPGEICFPRATDT